MNDIIGFYKAAHFDFQLHMTGGPSSLIYILKHFRHYQEAYAEEERRRIAGK